MVLSTVPTVPAGTRPLRDILYSLGVQPGEINYNPATGRVSVRGTEYDFGGVNVGGRIYTTEDAVKKALASVNLPYQPVGLDLKAVLDAITAANTIQNVPAPTPTFQTPQNLASLANQVYSALSPMVESQKQQSAEEFGRALTALANSWAARGMYASGGAGAMEQELARAYGRTLNDIVNRARAEAVSQAIQFGQLGLQERDLLAGIARSNQEAAMARAQNTVNNLLSALGLQESLVQGAASRSLAEREFAEGIRRWEAELAQRKSEFERGLALRMKEIGVTDVDDIRFVAEKIWRATLPTATALERIEAEITMRRLGLTWDDIASIISSQVGPETEQQTTRWKRKAGGAGAGGMTAVARSE